MAVQLNIASLVAAVAGPLVLLIALWWFRDPLSTLMKELPRRLRSLSAAGFTIELADANPSSLADLQLGIDLRREGTSNDINDSTLGSFYRQIEDPTRIDYAVVDLGCGMEWLSSRLFILSIILRRMRGLQAIVFVELRADTSRRLVGICEAEAVRWRLGARWPLFESALAAAELMVWGQPYQQGRATTRRSTAPRLSLPVPISPFNIANPGAAIVNDEGRLERPPPLLPATEPAARLLREFLGALQQPGLPASSDWQQLPTSPASPRPISEYSVWLTSLLLADVLDCSLNERSLKLHDWQGWSAELRVRAIVENADDWIAVTRDERVFDRLLDRRELMDALGRSVTSQI